MKKFLACLILVQAVSGGGVRAMDESKFDCRTELREIQIMLSNAKLTPDAVKQYLTLHFRGEAEADRGDSECCRTTVSEIYKMFNLPYIEKK
jgi:hypothetical protein